MIKYLNRIEAAIGKHGAADVRRMATATMQQALPPLGPVLPGSLAGGAAFGTKVSIDYWLVGPCPREDNAASPGTA